MGRLNSYKEIYIPVTVTYIADDAFEGSEDAIIHAPDGSFASDYANEHEMLREGTDTTYLEDQIQYLMDIVNEIEEIGSEEEIGDLNILFMDAETYDESLSESIEKLNAFQEEMLDANYLYQISMSDFTESFEQITSVINDQNGQTSENGIVITIDGLSYGMYGNEAIVFGKEINLLSTAASDDGEILRLELESDGIRCFLVADDSGITMYSGDQKAIAQGLNVKSISARSAGSVIKGKVFALLEKISDWRIAATTFISKAGIQIKTAIQETEKLVDKAAGAIKNAKSIRDSVKAKKDFADKKWYEATVEHDADGIAFYEAESQKYEKQLADAQTKLSETQTNHRKALSRLKVLGNIQAFFAAINIADACDTIVKATLRYNEIRDIQSHGHPTDAEADNTELLPAIVELNKHIAAAYTTLALECINAGINIYQVLDTAVFTVSALGGPIGLAIAGAEKLTVGIVLKALGEFALQYAKEKFISGTSEYLYGKVKTMDEQLHCFITGRVISEDTGKPIPRVKITCGSVIAYTNFQGVYSIKAGIGKHILEFTKQGYNMRQYAVNIAQNTNRKMPDIKMTARGTVAGHVKDATTGKALEGVTVTYNYYQTITDSNGFYQFVLPIGTGEMTFSKDGYIEQKYQGVAAETNTTTVRNAVLSKQISSNQFRAVLTWGAVPADLDAHLTGPGYHISFLNKTGTNAQLDVDDTTSYGPETITFTIVEGGVYRYYVHDYSNKDSGKSYALGYSGATVTVYNGSTIIAVVQIPKGAGLYWNVFTVENGQFRVTNTLN